ncbi:hypothetical protein [Phytohabitans kaempferiae]|uniref:Glycosyltransferase RgtA/B/C/D-like domain-containing protein n=1 Tax=Phytohabitans kaempferiae TaxID=1620943 RepID=A0ABV6MHC3_9ACTN
MLWRLLRTHWPFLVLLAAGLVLRVLVMIAYNPGFWFRGDSNIYVNGAFSHIPNPSRPFGYSFAVWVLSPFHSVRLIVGLQHLLGLAVAALVYAFLRRRSVSRWWATAAVAPILLDARTVLLEHFLLAESLFIALLVCAVIALCWSPRPGWWAVAGAGVLLSAAALTRTIGLPLVGAVVVFLLVRRVGLARIGVFAVVFAIPLAGYAVWYQSHYGVYSLGTYSGRFLWARTTSFVQCDKLDLTPAERQICPPEPLDERMPVDVYIWSRHSPAAKLPEREHDPLFGSFARKAILAQPGDYARTVVVESWLLVRPGPDPDERYTCFEQLWHFPEPGITGCQAAMAPWDPATREPRVDVSKYDHALVPAMHLYGRVATLPATFTAICLLVAVAAPLVRLARRARSRDGDRPRGADDPGGLDTPPPAAEPAAKGACRDDPGRRDVVDSLFLTGVAFGMIVISVATSVMEPRYTVPSIPLAALGAALALRGRRGTVPPTKPAPVPAEPVARPVEKEPLAA